MAARMKSINANAVNGYYLESEEIVRSHVHHVADLQTDTKAGLSNVMYKNNRRYYIYVLFVSVITCPAHTGTPLATV